MFMYLFLSAGIGKKLTGIEHAILRRKKLFNDMAIENKVVTVNFNRDYQEILESNDILKSEFLNIYDDYQNIFFLDRKNNTIKDFILNIKGDIEIKRVKSSLDYKIYVNNNYSYYIRCYEDNQISYINFFDNEHNKVKRHIFNKQGYLVQVIYLENNETKIIQYLNIFKKVVIEEFFNKEKRINTINTYEKETTVSFVNKDEWIKYWLNNLFEKYKFCSIYCDKNRIYSHILIKIPKKNYKVISVLHSSHLKFPKEIQKSPLNSNYKVCLNNSNYFDGYIVSTNEQKKDIHERFGRNIKVWVIPPAYLEDTGLLLEQSTEKFNVISVGRYYIEKRLDHIILAVEKLSKKYPEIKLDLYGFGNNNDEFSYKKSLRKLVIEHNLDKHVEFKGYSNNIVSKIEKAHVSVITSTVEGFCIGILDSLSVGTPVVSYNIKYGPSDMIENKISGFLVEEGSISHLADCIESVYLDSSMRNSAFNSAKKFSKSTLKEKWLNHIFELSNI